MIRDVVHHFCNRTALGCRIVEIGKGQRHQRIFVDTRPGISGDHTQNIWVVIRSRYPLGQDTTIGLRPRIIRVG